MVIAIAVASKHSYKYAKHQIKESFFLYLLQIIQKIIIIHYNNIFQKVYKEDILQETKMLSHVAAYLSF
jgi:hypothetical protein